MSDRVTEKAVEHAKAFLSGLFMGLRTAQIHDHQNKAFEKAVHTVLEAANRLYSASGGFQIQFVDQSVFLNGARMRFEGGLYQTIQTLESVLRSKDLGGLSMSTPPSFEGVRTLVVELAKDGGMDREILESLEIGLLGPQTLSEQDPAEMKADRRLLAVQSYAKLILALREQLRRVRTEKREGRSSRLRLRIVRVVQDLVELAGDRPDFLLRLSSNAGGAEAEILHGVNATLLALVMGHALRLGRRALVDLAMGTLFHHIGAEEDAELSAKTRHASLARVLADSAVSSSSMARATVVAHYRKHADAACVFRRRPPHLFSRIAGVTITYSQLVVGYGLGRRLRAPPLDVLRVLMEDRSGRLDPDLVDLLINVLRAFPVGCHVVLDSGEHAIVTSHLGSSRWDRPVVAVRGANPRNIDLMVRHDGRLPHRIAATARFLGLESALSAEDKALPRAPAASAGASAPPRTPPLERPPRFSEEPAPLLDAAVAAESSRPRGAEQPPEDLDELFKEFLAEDARKKPSMDTSYSSSGESEN